MLLFLVDEKKQNNFFDNDLTLPQVLSLNLDEWTDEQVDALVKLGGNTLVNKKYEVHLPINNIRKPRPDSSIEERSDFIR